MMSFVNHQLPAIPSVDAVTYLPLQPTYQRYSMIVATIWLLILLVTMYSCHALGWLGVHHVIGAATIAWGLLACWILWITQQAYRIAGYAIRQHDIIYRSGYLWRSVTAVPYSRIQHTEVSQGPIGRLLQLYELQVFTAGGANSDLHIRGLDQHTAESIRAFIISQADDASGRS